MSYTSAYMARQTTTMTTEAVREKFGMPGAPKGQPVKKKKPEQVMVFDKEAQAYVSQDQKQPGKVPSRLEKYPIKQTPLQGPLYITPAIEGQQGKRRAPSLARDEETKKNKAARARTESMIQYGEKEFSESDLVEAMGGKVVITPTEKVDEAIPPTAADVRSMKALIAQERKKFMALPPKPDAIAEDDGTPEQDELAATINEQQDYLKRMEENFDARARQLETDLRGIEEEQAGMDACDTSFFDADQAKYFNDYADYLENQKEKLEDELDRLLDEPMKKKTGKKRASSARSRPRAKTRRVAVKRGPVKARRRKSTSSGRRSPGSPARSR